MSYLKVVCFQMLDFKTSKANSEVSKSNSYVLVRNNFFLEDDVTSEGAVFYNVLYYQQLSVARNQISFYAYWELRKIKRNVIGAMTRGGFHKELRISLIPSWDTLLFLT